MARSDRPAPAPRSRVRLAQTLGIALAALLGACGEPATTPAPAAAPTTVVTGEPSGRTPLGSVPLPLLGPAPSASAIAAPARAGDFAARINELSEPDGAFFSDNLISNETSYLQPAAALAKLATPGGVYVGVGPEQNFTYIALTRPKWAFIVDLRRQNMILHLLYKAVFEEATSRSHFLALLLGRPYDAASAPAADAKIAAVIAHAEKNPPDERGFADAHAKLRARVERFYALDGEDRKTLELLHQTFVKRQLDIRFELHQSSGRRYPSLRELIAWEDPDGVARGFLADEEAFRFVQGLEKQDRIVPIVGDFAGDRAMPGLAKHLAREGLVVSSFYVSNVEQYLLEDPKVWRKWARNVAALPIDDRSLFIRAWLDQGRAHPRQMKGHRTASVLQRMSDFTERQSKVGFRNFWEVATEKVLGEGGEAL